MDDAVPATIRPFEPRDAAAVRRIVRDVLDSFGLSMDSATDADLEDVERSYAQGAFLVVELGGQVVGCGGVCVHSPMQAEIRKMYLLREARGRGLGRRLLEELIGEARRRGVRQLYLETNAVLRDAIALYRKFGFEERTGDESLSSRCDIYMEKVISG